MEYNRIMSTRVEAIYEHGVLRPIQPLPFAEHEHVTITVDLLDDDIDYQFIAECKARVAQLPQLPKIEETREMLRSVPGSFAEEIIKARGEW